jgi:hypothetical protein
MKRLMFASMIFLSAPLLAQTKAGKTDTVKHAVFYTCAHTAGCCPGNASLIFSAKEQRALQNAAPVQNVCIPLNGKRRQQLSAKEMMKAAITN